MKNKKQLSAGERDDLLKILKQRFEKNMNRHKGVDWKNVEERLLNQPSKLRILNEMEETGGEPDVISVDKKTGEYVFCDCSAESPAGRRSLCYDREALDSRKEHKPATSAMEMADSIGIEMLSEDEYLALQKLGKFDGKTSSWIRTPEEMRKLGGALFGDLRFGRVFFYHNGASSYYAARGFRGTLRA